MAKKNRTPSGTPGEPQRTKHLTDNQCKTAAARINMERRTYEADFIQYGRTNFRYSFYAGSFVPIWPANNDKCREKINRLYHPEEAAIIIENLTA